MLSMNRCATADADGASCHVRTPVVYAGWQTASGKILVTPPVVAGKRTPVRAINWRRARSNRLYCQSRPRGKNDVERWRQYGNKNLPDDARTFT